MIDQHSFFSSRAESYKYDEEKYKILSACAAKSKKYVIDGQQPAMPIFKAARLFDPFFFVTMNKNFEVYIEIIPELAACKDEWAI